MISYVNCKSTPGQAAHYTLIHEIALWAAGQKIDSGHYTQDNHICLYFWQLKFVHEAVEISALDVHVFHLVLVAQMNMKLFLVYRVRFSVKNVILNFQPDWSNFFHPILAKKCPPIKVN